MSQSLWPYALVVLVCVSLAHTADAATRAPTDACPAFPTPRKAKLVRVADNMLVNGVPMTIVRLESEEPLEAIQAFYRQSWASAEKRFAPIEYELGPWQVIAAQRGECFYTAQLKNFGRTGSEGLLGVSAPPGKEVVTEAVPMLPGSRLLNDLAHNDGGKTARSVMLNNGFTPAANADFYRRNLESDGWKVSNHYRLDQPNQKGDVMVFRKGVRELSLTTMRDPQDAKRANVLLNYVDQP
jgi:hypothetical protein